MPTISGTAGNDNLVGTDGDDVIDGLGGDDSINGGTGADILRGGPGTNTIFGGAGDDIISDGNQREPPAGPSLLDGGSGRDTLDYSGYVYSGFYSQVLDFITTSETGDDVLVNLNYPGLSSKSAGQTSRASNFEVIIGSASSGLFDFTYRSAAIEIHAGEGANVIRGGAGADLIYGDGGDDRITVGTGDRAYGGTGNDFFEVTAGVTYAPGTRAEGGAGVNTLSAYLQGNSSHTIGLSSAGFTWQGISFSDIQNIVLTSVSGSGLNVNVTGDERANRIELYSPQSGDTAVIDGGAGDDVILTGFANATVNGGDGNDTLSGLGTFLGGAGNDIITANGVTGSGLADGGTGDDLIQGGGVLRGGDGDDRLVFTTGTAFAGQAIDGGSGTDTAQFNTSVTVNLLNSSATVTLPGGVLTVAVAVSGIENVQGSIRGDSITGDNGANVLVGGLGLDFIYGLDGDDRIFGDGETGESASDSFDILDGGAGNDAIFGEGGNDQISGSAGDDILDGGSGNDILDGGSGYDIADFNHARSLAVFSYENGNIIVEGPRGRDVLSNVETIRFSDGVYDVANGKVSAEARQTLTGTANPDALAGGGSSDTIFGLGGADRITGGGGSDRIDGGDGFDTAVYSGVVRQYAHSSTSIAGGREGGTDTLTSIEEASFVDGRLSFDVNGNAAIVDRLYDATFDRGADDSGMAGWLKAMATGLTAQDIANEFSRSAEFTSRYNGTSNQQFVESMYRFSLGREGDAAGVQGWVGLLNASTLTRAQVLLQFSESAEHRNQLASDVSQGIFIQDDVTLGIARLYSAVLDRLPDVDGLAGWRTAAASGVSLLDIARDFTRSAEFQSRFGALSNQSFVENLYRFTLDREGDAAGIAGWVSVLNTGTSRERVVLEFSESPEHVRLMLPITEGGIVYAGYAGQPQLEAVEASAGHIGTDEAKAVPIGAGEALRANLEDLSHDAFVLSVQWDAALPGEALPSLLDNDASHSINALQAAVGDQGDHALAMFEAPDTGTFDVSSPWMRSQVHDTWI